MAKLKRISDPKENSRKWSLFRGRKQIFWRRLKQLFRELRHSKVLKLFMAIPLDPIWYYFAIITVMVQFNMNLYIATTSSCSRQSFELYTFLENLDYLYVVDVVAIFFIKVLRVRKPLICLADRPYIVLVVEAVTLLPYWSMLPKNLPKEHQNIYCLILLKYLLREVRPLYFLILYNRQLITKPIITYFVLVFGVSVLGLTSVVMYCNLEQKAGNICNNPARAVAVGVSNVALIPFGDSPIDSIIWNMGSTIIVTVAFIVLLIPTMVQLTLNIIFSNMLRYIYIFIYESIRLTHVIYDVPVYLKNQTAKYFDDIWKNCGGYSEDLGFFEEALHPALTKEIRLDVSWPAFLHSRMFRHFGMSTLLQLSEVIRHQFLVAGDYVYKKGEIKQKMVYVVSGIINLLSEVDAESPIISLSRGTCIGEASLMISYKSGNTVQCKTFCELLVIERRDFIKVMKKLSSKGRSLRRIIEDRVVSARHLKHLSDSARSKVTHSYRNRDTYTVHWLKHTLHEMMSIDEESTREHELQNIYLLHRIDETVFDPLVFTAEYLDMLSIAERHETEKDSVFVKSTFPYVFQPDSVVIILYKYVVAIVVVFASLWFPYRSFLMSSIGGNFFPCFLVTTTFVLDVVFQLFTAITSRNGFITKKSAIFLYRLRLFSFWTDIAASIPLEAFTAVIIHDLNDRYSAMLRLNRLLKIWTLATMFKEWEKAFKANVILLRYVKYTILHLYIIYLVYCVMRYLYPDRDNGFLLFTASLLSLISKNKDTDFLTPDIKLFVIVNVAFQVIYIAKFVYIVSAIVMANSSRLYAQQYCHDVFTKIEASNLPDIYKVRTAEYLRLQYEENKGIRLRTNFYYLSRITKTLHNDTIDAITSDIWKHFTFFGDFLLEIMDDLCSVMSLETLPANEVIVYSGDYFRKCYIKYVGIIEIVDQFGNVLSQENETTNRVINLVPCLLDVPSLFTMKTITVNRFIVFKIENLLLAISRHPKYNEILQKTIAECSDISERLVELASVETNFVVPPDKLPPKKNVHTFSYNFTNDTQEEYEYYSPFDRLYPVSFLRVFLLRSTIYPDSNFLIIWESFRSFFAIMSALLYMMPPLLLTPYRILLILLDLTAYLDIYARMHVCYHTEDGVLVTHPLHTAKHYFAHGFLVDLMGVFPIATLSTPYDAVSYFATYANRLLQLHRYFSFMYMLQFKSLTAVRSAFMISYLPVLLVVGNFFGSFIIHSECDFGVGLVKELPEKVMCYNDSIVEMSNFHKPITPLIGQAIALYVGVSFVTTAGWQNFVVLRDATRTRVVILGFIGQTLLVTCIGYVATYFIYRHGLLIDYQHAMRQLLAFMKLLRVPKELRKYTINSCEDKWTLLKGKPFQFVIRKLHEPIQTDILYDCYGFRAYNTSAFKTKSIPFYRSLIAISTYDIVVKDGYAVTINDITNTLAIILRGNVDVLAADGTILVRLYPGAIIGNLENREWCRAKVSVVANCHIEIFNVRSTMFHYILSRFPKTKAEFEALKLRYLYYIPSLTEMVNPDEAEHYAPKKKLIFTKTFHPDSFFIKLWLTIQLIFPCYIGILLDFFQMSTGNHNSWIVICQYCCDALFTCHFVFRNRIAYVNEYGVLVKDPQKIKERNAKNKFKYWLTFCSIIPFDLLTFLLPINSGTMKTLYAILRMNRMLRLSYIFEFFAIMNQKLNTNIYVVRFGFIIVWTSLAMCGISAILGVCACNLKVNMEPHIPSCSVLHEMEEIEIGRLHSKLLHLTLHGLTLTTQYEYSPQHPLMMFLFVMLLLINHSLRVIITGQVFAAIAEANDIHVAFKMIRWRLDFHCASQDLHPSVMWRMSTYTDLLWFLYKGVQYPTMLTSLNPYIKDVLLACCCNRFFANHIIFKDCHPDFVRQMMCKVTFRMSFDSGYIEFKDSVEGEMIFILQGEIEVLEDMFRNKCVFMLKAGQSFGILQGIYEDTAYCYSYRCIGTTIVVVLKYQDWRHLLKFYPASAYIIYNRSQFYTGF